jgi:hypothetical protein
MNEHDNFGKSLSFDANSVTVLIDNEAPGFHRAGTMCIYEIVCTQRIKVVLSAAIYDYDT